MHLAGQPGLVNDNQRAARVIPLSNPDRLVLDVLDTGLSPKVRLPAGGGVIKAVRSDGEEREGLNEASRAGWVQVGAAVAAAIVFLVLWDVIVFEIASVAFLVGLLLIFAVRSPLWLVAFPVGLTALIYLLFRLLLRVPR